MAKKKRKEYVYDEETGGVVERSTDAADSDEEGKKKGGPEVLLNNMLLQSFTATWHPAEVDGDTPFERMRLIDLRTYFQCYTTDDARCIDLLPFYLAELSKLGYQMHTDSMGTPYLPVKR